MANEIDIIVKSVEPPVADPTVKRTITFDVKHNGDNKIIAVDQSLKGRADDNVLWENIKIEARKLYNEYEAQKVWLEHTLPKTFPINL